MEVIEFEAEDGNIYNLSIIDETKINGIDYLLVCEELAEDLDENEEVEVMVLKAIPGASEDEELETYETVEDEEELKAVTKVFAEQLSEEDIDLEF